LKLALGLIRIVTLILHEHQRHGHIYLKP